MKPSSIVPPVKRYMPRSGTSDEHGDDAEADPCPQRSPVAAAQTATATDHERSAVGGPCGEEASGRRLLAWRPRGRVDSPIRRVDRSLVRPPAGADRRRHDVGRRASAAGRRRRPRPHALVPGARPGDDRVPRPRRVHPAHPVDRAARAHRRVPGPGQPSRPAQLLPARSGVPGCSDRRRGRWRRRPWRSTSRRSPRRCGSASGEPAGAASSVSAPCWPWRSAATASCCSPSRGTRTCRCSPGSSCCSPRGRCCAATR